MERDMHENLIDQDILTKAKKLGLSVEIFPDTKNGNPISLMPFHGRMFRLIAVGDGDYKTLSDSLATDTYFSASTDKKRLMVDDIVLNEHNRDIETVISLFFFTRNPNLRKDKFNYCLVYKNPDELLGFAYAQKEYMSQDELEQQIKEFTIWANDQVHGFRITDLKTTKPTTLIERFGFTDNALLNQTLTEQLNYCQAIEERVR